MKFLFPLYYFGDTFFNVCFFSVLDEMKWMLRDEIAFALTKTMPISSQTLEFVRNHVQSSVGKTGSNVETVDLNFVFGTQISLDKFKENFLCFDIGGFVLKEQGDFYYLDVADGEQISRDLSGARRKVVRQQHQQQQQLSPVKEATTPQQTEDDVESHNVSSEMEDVIEESEDSVDILDYQMFEEERCDRASIMSNLSCIFQLDQERVNMFIHFRDSNVQVQRILKYRVSQNKCSHVTVYGTYMKHFWDNLSKKRA